MSNPNPVEPGYIRVSNQFANGDPFGYVNGNRFVMIGPAENKAYLIDSEGKISSVNQSISGTTSEEIVAQINAAYPSVGYLTYEIKNYSIGDEVEIGGEV